MIRKFALLAALLALAAPSWADVFQREYGVATTIPFKLYDPTTGGLDVDEVDGGAEVTLDCDGTPATATNDFVDEGAWYSIALTATEMQCANIAITIAATDTNVVFVQTIGNASAAVDDDGGWYDAIPWNAAWDAEVQSEATDALNAYDPPTNAELTSAVANVSVDELQATAIADLFNTDSGTTYSSAIAGSAVAEIADNAGGSSLTEAGIADAVWDEVIHTNKSTPACSPWRRWCWR